MEAAASTGNERKTVMRMRNRILLYSGLASTVLVLAPVTGAAAETGLPAAGVAAGAPPGYVIKSTSGISLPNNDGTFGMAKCPKGTVVLSGGAYITSSSVKAGINASFPAGQRIWEAVANNFSGTATTFSVYAVCAKRPQGYEQLTGAEVSNPAGDQDSGAENCPAGDVVLGGGAFDDDPSFSVGMSSSYPSTSGSWTAAVSNFSTTDSQFEAIALCASPFPHYAIPATSASDPAGVQKGIIQDCTGKAVVLGGGNQSSNTTNLRIEMKATQPFPASGTGWKSGENNDTGSSTTLTSYAICAT
jgi:hypothetical protein